MDQPKEDPVKAGRLFLTYILLMPLFAAAEE
jgi:hypothetical protein